VAKLALRSYARELEGLIEKGQIDEAIAHCRHILKFHPKHLEIYRLLGKAYLEAKQYSEAEDIFNRILVAVPDDFVSHAGMSIVKDEKGNLDEALWHMERAFETQPSNAAIQGELQRLYGRRDGVEPPRIRMTRGALAHMYMQGGLYPQAISEIRAILAQDPQRADMQILLAEAFFHSGQRADAAEVCNRLLASLPYCFEANRIMVELFHGKENIDKAQEYRQRVCELDPYAMYAPDSVLHSTEVPDNTILVERLATGGQEVQVMKSTRSVEAQPDWLSKDIAAIKEEGGTTRQEAERTEIDENISIPPSEINPPSPMDISRSTVSPESSITSPPAGSIPEFLREAGWQESSGDAMDENVSSPFETGTTGGLITGETGSSDDELIPVELPDWLKSKAPGGDESKPSETEPLPDWLDQLTAAGDSGEDRGDKPSDATSAWFKDLSDSGSPPVKPQPFHTEEREITSAFTEMPVGVSEAHGVSTSVDPEKEQTSNSVLGSGPSQTPAGISEPEQNEAMGWLESLASKHGAKEEELVTNPAERKDNPPDWVSEVMHEIDDQPSGSKTSGAAVPSEDETGVWLRGLNKEDAATSEPGITDSEPSAGAEGSPPGWLNDLGNKSISDEPVGSNEEDLPVWLQNLKTVSQGSRSDSQFEKETGRLPAEQMKENETRSDPSSFPIPSAFDSTETADPQRADQPAETPEETGSSQSEEMEMPNWLKGMDQNVPAIDGQEDLSTMPDWLKPMESKLAEPSPMDNGEKTKLPDLPGLDDLQVEKSLTNDSSPREPDLSDWLQSLDDVPPGIPATTAIDTMPRWMKGEMEAPPKAEPTAPNDWRPIEEPNAPSPEPKSSTAAPLEDNVPQSQPVQELKPMKSDGENHELIQAQGSLKSGDLSTALDRYNQFIKHGTLLDETIHDLRQAVYQYPIEVSLWQALGDAYMRANRLQEALDAFNKAEELLR
jgi:tetratricopeptide (TPR) repeat protein